jgi:hypothetical protein
MATAILPGRAALEQAAASGTTVPFDYGFRVELHGTPGRSVRRTIQVSTGGAFVAVSVGYGFIPAVEQKRFGLVQTPAAPGVVVGGVRAAPRSLATITLGDVLTSIRTAIASSRGRSRDRMAAAFRTGFRVNPDVLSRLVSGQPLSADDAAALFELAGTPGEVQFLYALADDATGREFQSEPILSTAGLGSAEGERPFRQYPMPLRFETGSIIRVDVTELEHEAGVLHMALHGYRILPGATVSAGPNAPPALRRRRR